MIFDCLTSTSSTIALIFPIASDCSTSDCCKTLNASSSVFWLTSTFASMLPASLAELACVSPNNPPSLSLILSGLFRSWLIVVSAFVCSWSRLLSSPSRLDNRSKASSSFPSGSSACATTSAISVCLPASSTAFSSVLSSFASRSSCSLLRPSWTFCLSMPVLTSSINSLISRYNTSSSTPNAPSWKRGLSTISCNTCIELTPPLLPPAPRRAAPGCGFDSPGCRTLPASGCVPVRFSPTAPALVLL